MIVCNPAATKICTSCNGEGEIWESVPDIGPPYMWSEHKVECECCGGTGLRSYDVEDVDGYTVRLLKTGQCCVYGDGLMSVFLPDETEIEIASLEDIELCEC